LSGLNIGRNGTHTSRSRSIGRASSFAGRLGERQDCIVFTTKKLDSAAPILRSRSPDRGPAPCRRSHRKPSTGCQISGKLPSGKEMATERENWARSDGFRSRAFAIPPPNGPEARRWSGGGRPLPATLFPSAEKGPPNENACPSSSGMSHRETAFGQTDRDERGGKRALPANCFAPDFHQKTIAEANRCRGFPDIPGVFSTIGDLDF